LALSHAYGQSSTVSYNGVHAIVGAKIVVGDGRVLEKGTLVIRDGMIVAVAPDAAVPRGADVLDGKGLTVYPGFIDAYTTNGIAAPPSSPAKADPDTNVGEYASAFMRESVRKGIRPEERAVENLALTDEFLKPYQTAGFTTVLIAPSGGDMSGVAALVNLSGRPVRECTVVAEVAEAIGFGSQAWGEGYPSSLMGHIAQLRQTFLDAQWYLAVDRSFRAGGIRRPPSDRSLISILPVLDGKLPAVWDADNEHQIERSLNLSSEFGLKPMIAGGSEAWKQLDAIKKSGAPILLSIAFGREPGSKETPPPGGPPKAETDTPAERTIEENPAKLIEQLRLYRETLKNASVLAAAGIPVALSTKGCKSQSEFMDNLRKAVEAGFPKEAALRAMTIDAARIFGVDRQTGTLEVGKIANVTVMTGDFLDAKSKVKMLYVDGRKIDPSKAAATPTPRFRFGAEGN